MKHFHKIAEGIDFSGVQDQLAAHPELWNTNTDRLTRAGSPFVGTSDIWLRYRRLDELTSLDRYREPHFAAFYPAWKLLPTLHHIVFGLMSQVKAVYLGGVLITRIPAGGCVAPHHDRGSWHAEFCNTKVYAVIQANDQCVNYCGDEQIVIKAGEAVTFDNLLTHSVENRGFTDRVTLICCFRVE